MASKIKIKTFEDNNTHFNIHRNNYTLCGLETGGDESKGIQIGKRVETKVNCPDCIRIVEYCKSIERNEWK